jgi:hypothetical protein
VSFIFLGRYAHVDYGRLNCGARINDLSFATVEIVRPRLLEERKFSCRLSRAFITLVRCAGSHLPEGRKVAGI